MKKLIYIVPASLLLLFLQIAYGAKMAPLKAIQFKTPAPAGSVQFLAVGRPSMLKIHGTGSKLEGKLQVQGKEVSGKVSIPLSTLDSGIALRTEHMKEKYLEVKKFPQAELELVQAEVDEKTLSTSGEKPFRGKLSLHGKQKEVQGTFELKDGVVKAKFPLTLSDYAIEIPSYLGIKVADLVDVNVEIPFQKD